MGKRDNNFSKKQIKGIDITIKSVSKKYPFVKGWRFDEGFMNYDSIIYIDLFVDYNKVAEFYNDKIHPIFIHDEKPLSSSLLMYFLSKNPITSDDREEKDKYFEMMYNQNQTIKKYVNFVYENLPDEFAIFFPIDSGIDTTYYRCQLTPDDFIDISRG